MNGRMSNWYLVAVYVLVVGSGLGLTGCTTSSARQPYSPISTAAPDDMALDWPTQQPIPTPDGAHIASIPDQPTWIVGEQKVWRFLVTPLPNERVHIGAVSEITPRALSIEPSGYSVREDISPWEPVTSSDQYVPPKKLFVRDSETGQEIRLGNDRGDALLKATTEKYVVWRYQWDGISETIGLETGLYAYVPSTGEEIVIAQKPQRRPGDPVIGGDWVLYIEVNSTENSHHVNLYAHNLVSGEDFLIGQNIPYNQRFNNRLSSDYYDVEDGRAVWVDVKLAPDSIQMIRVCDLETRVTRTLNVPNTQSPVQPSISGDIVVWWDRFWRGYDLRQDELFTIPTVPPGWDNVSVQPAEMVTVQDDQLYWALEVDDQIYHFTAPVIRD